MVDEAAGSDDQDGDGMTMEEKEKMYRDRPSKVFNNMFRQPDVWMGYADINNIKEYRTVKIKSNCIKIIAEKGKGAEPEYKPYIG